MILAAVGPSLSSDPARSDAVILQVMFAGHVCTGVVQLGTPSSGRTSAVAPQLTVVGAAIAAGAAAKPQAVIAKAATPERLKHLFMPIPVR